MFQRQWFPQDSQFNLSPIANKIERLICRHEYDSAMQLLGRTPSFPLWYHTKILRRILHLNNRADRLRNSNPPYPVYIHWSGFWPNMDPYNCQLLDLFNASTPDLYFITVDNMLQADVTISSCYGAQPIHPSPYGALQLIFLGENIRPFLSVFDYSISSDQSDYCGRNVYLPLWLLELDWFSGKTYPDRSPLCLQSVTHGFHYNPAQRNMRVIYVGNNNEPWRLSMLNHLRQHNITVDTYGSHTNPVEDKCLLYSNYSLILSFENGYNPGYITEKIIHAYASQTPLLYYGCLHGSVFHNSQYPILCMPSMSIPDLINRIHSLFEREGSIYFQPLLTHDTLMTQYQNVLNSLSSKFSQFILSH